ncbi:MAG: hypothetical protein U1F25_17685 [Rubrivivax sp.]
MPDSRRHDRPDATVVALRERPEHCAFFAAAFEAEWPSWYGPGGRGNAQADLLAFADPSGSLPVGVVAIGAAISRSVWQRAKASSIPSHAHLSPWAAAGYVVPSWRRKGIGALLTALLGVASRLGFECVYRATATSESLLVRRWSLIEEVVHEGRVLRVFRSGLSSHGMLADARHGGYQSSLTGVVARTQGRLARRSDVHPAVARPEGCAVRPFDADCHGLPRALLGTQHHARPRPALES